MVKFVPRVEKETNVQPFRVSFILSGVLAWLLHVKRFCFDETEG